MSVMPFGVSPTRTSTAPIGSVTRLTEALAKMFSMGRTSLTTCGDRCAGSLTDDVGRARSASRFEAQDSRGFGSCPGPVRGQVGALQVRCGTQPALDGLADLGQLLHLLRRELVEQPLPHLGHMPR